MKENAINWDAVPDVITKDQLYRICHISKSTALYLLQSGKIPASTRAGKHAATKSKRRMSLPSWKTARCFLKATPLRQAGTKAIILSTWRNSSRNRARAFAAVLYRAAFRLSRRADYAGGFQNHRIRKNFNQQLVQSGAHQVFPKKQRQPHSEGLSGGVLLLDLLSYHHPQKEVRSNDKFSGRAVLRKC